jgi:DNA-binding NtrC family response regulator
VLHVALPPSRELRRDIRHHVRELKNVVERAVVLSDGLEIGVSERTLWYKLKRFRLEPRSTQNSCRRGTRLRGGARHSS